MATWGDKLGRAGRPEAGVGYSMPPEQVPREEEIIYAQWQKGLNTAESPENIPEDAASAMVDVEIDDTDALIRGAGVTLDQDISPRVATWMFQQAAVDFSTELLVIDPPHLGVKSTGAFSFSNLGIAATTQFGWCAADVAGTLIFSNGLDATYTRDAGAAVITDITSDIVAQCFATAFGRVFAGAVVDAITGLQSLAVYWNAASGAVDDWAGLGSGAEFLIANNLEADRIEAIVPLGLQSMGILCRKSLWAGYPTGDSDRPADFQLRFVGSGCVARDTAAGTPAGIMYLSDNGICLFDLNASKVMSDVINAELLPLDYAQLSAYRACYDMTSRRYILVTPFKTFIYEFPIDSQDGQPGRPARWLIRSFVADSLVMFTDQTGNVYWNTVVGPWNLQTLTWAEMLIGEQNAPAIPFFGKTSEVGFEDYTATDNMGVAQTPFWITPQALKQVTDNIETHYFEIQYRSQADAEISLIVTNTLGELDDRLCKTVTLPSTSGVRKKVLTFTHTMLGMGTTLKVKFGDTAICAIERVRRVVMKAGPSISVTV